MKYFLLIFLIMQSGYLYANSCLELLNSETTESRSVRESERTVLLIESVDRLMIDHGARHFKIGSETSSWHIKTIVDLLVTEFSSPTVAQSFNLRHFVLKNSGNYSQEALAGHYLAAQFALNYLYDSAETDVDKHLIQVQMNWFFEDKPI